MRRSAAVATVCLLVAGPLAGAGPHEADAGAQGPTLLYSCTTITEPGVYVLVRDVRADRATCFDVRASGVLLDGGGHLIDGNRTEPGSTAVAVAPPDRGTGTGAPAAPGRTTGAPAAPGRTTGTPAAPGGATGTPAASGRLTDVVVRDVRVSRWAYGVRLRDVADSRVEGAVVTRSLTAVAVGRAANVTVRDVAARFNDVGLSLIDARTARVRNVTTAWSGFAGVLVGNATDVDLAGVDASYADDGIAVLDAADVTLADARVAHNRRRGLLLWRTDGSTVRDLTVAGNEGPFRRERNSTAATYGAARDVVLVDASGNEVDFTTGGVVGWSVAVVGDSRANDLDYRSGATTALVFEGRNVSVTAPASIPGAPPGFAFVRRPVRVTAVGSNAAVRLRYHYGNATTSDVGNGSSGDAADGGPEDDHAADDDGPAAVPETIRLWRLVAGQWEPLDWPVVLDTDARTVAVARDLPAGTDETLAPIGRDDRASRNGRHCGPPGGRDVGLSACFG